MTPDLAQWSAAEVDAVDICAQFGVSVNLADNSGPINQALATLGPLGLRALITKPGNYAIQNPIVIGDSDGTRLSTWTATLEGVGNPGWLGQFQGPRVKISWHGADGADMIQLLGPIASPGLKRLMIDSSAGPQANRAILSTASQFGVFEDLQIYLPRQGIRCIPVAPFGGRVTNHQHNTWRRIGIVTIGTAGASSQNYGVQLASNGLTTANCAFDDWEHVWIQVPGSSIGSTLQALYLEGCDTNWFRGLHLLYAGGGTDGQFSVCFDYSGANTGWPEGNLIEAIDLVKPARSVGNPTGAPGNIIAGLSPANGVPANPLIQGVRYDYWETQRSQGQPGILSPSDSGWSPASQVAAANQAYVARFVPDVDMAITKVAFNVTTAATVNDNIDVGIYDGAGNKLASTGSTAGVVNVAGVRTVNLAANLIAGKVYYLAISYGAVGGVAATIQMANAGATNSNALFGGGLPNLRLGQQAAAFPLPAAIAPALNAIGPMAAVRTA